MKRKFRFTTVIAVVATLFITGSCSKDKYQAPKPTIPTTTEEVLSSQGTSGLTYQGSSLPSSTSTSSTPVIVSITTNSNVITGGANQLTINLTDQENDVTDVIYAIKGLTGYYVQDVASGLNTLDLNIFINQINNEGNFKLQIGLRDAAGNVSLFEELPIKLITVGTGKLQVSLTWDQLNDVDLHLILPSGNEIFYGDPTGQGLTLFGTSTGPKLLDLDSNPDCIIDGVNNENITYAENIPLEVGVYTVRVDYYADCNGSATTNFVATARLNGNLVTPLSGANPASGSFASGTSDAGDYGAGVTVMTFEVATVNGRYAILPVSNGKQTKVDAGTSVSVTSKSKLDKIGK